MIKSFAKTIIIGSSSGGPEVLKKIFSNLSPALPFVYIIVQHIPLNYSNFFLENFKKCTSLDVIKVSDFAVLKKSTIVFIPNDVVVKFQKNINGKAMIRTLPTNNENNCNPIDQAMVAGANFFKKKTIGIILSGMGNDGKEGIKTIKKYGGYTIIQDPKTSQINSMPNASINEEIPNIIMKPNHIAAQLKNLVY